MNKSESKSQAEKLSQRLKKYGHQMKPEDLKITRERLAELEAEIETPEPRKSLAALLNEEQRVYPFYDYFGKEQGGSSYG